MPSGVAVRVGSQTLPVASSLTHSVDAHEPPCQRRAKMPKRSPTRPCQHTCRLPSGCAHTSWLNEGPSVSLTGSGALHADPSNRLAQTPTRLATERPNSSQGVPSAVIAAVGRKRSSGSSTTVVTWRSAAVLSSASSRSPRSGCHSSQPTSVPPPCAATLGRAALPLPSTTRTPPRVCPISFGAASSTAAARASWVGIWPSPSSTHM